MTCIGTENCVPRQKKELNKNVNSNHMLCLKHNLLSHNLSEEDIVLLFEPKICTAINTESNHSNSQE